MDVVEITDNPSSEDISLTVSPTPKRDTTLNSGINSNYYLVCNYCNNGVRFNQFEGFLQHVKTEHQKVSVSDPHIEVNAVGIKCDTIVISDTEEKQMPQNTSPQNPDTGKDSKIYYDLQTLSRSALFDIIDVFGQCACLWHEPTRQRSAQRDRFCAYYLILTKLQEHQKQATLPDVRNIVRQLVKNFQKALEPCTLHSGDQNELETIPDEPQPTTSHTVLERLMFLASDKESDIKEMNINKLCSFCNKGFGTYEGLWAHMKSVHVVLKTYTPTPNEKAQVDEVGDEQNKEEEEAPNVSHACKEKTSRKAFNNFFDIYNDNKSEDQSDATEESLPNTRLRKKRGAKSRLQRKRSYYETTSGESDLEEKPSSFYLNEYNDGFLIKFIDCFRKNECLWNTNCVMYHNRALKEKAYEELVQVYVKMLSHQPTPDIDAIKSIIRRLKYYYKRYQNGTPNRPVARHYIWQLMAFIEGGRRRKGNRTNFSGNGDSVSTGSYDCSKCSKKFKRFRFYNCHMLSKHPPTECPKCSEDFDNADDLKTHLLWYHRKDEECPICTTKSKDGAGDWKSSIHMAEHFHEHHCDDCDRIFYDYGNYNKHRSQCRQKYREFTCNQCKVVFSNHNKLYRHAMQKHTYGIRSTNKQRSKQTKAKPKKRSCYCC